MVLFVVRFGPSSGNGSPSGQTAPGRVAIGAQAPAIVGTSLDGTTFDLASLRGRPVIVNFWASWCGPCVQEFPLLQSTLADHQKDGLAIVGVLFKDDGGPAGQFVRRFGAQWPTVLDPGGKLATAYTIVAPPQTYFIDRQGIVRERQIGQLLPEDLARELPAILQ